MNVHNSSLRPVDLDEFERELREIASSSSVAKKVGDPLAELARMVGREVSARGKPRPRVDGWEAPARGQETHQAIGGEKAWQYSDSDHAQADVPAEAVAIPADQASNGIVRQHAHGHDLADGASDDPWADPHQEYEASQHEDEFVYVGEPKAPSVGRRVSDALPRQRARANASWRSLVHHRPFALAGALALIVIGVSAAALALFTQMAGIDVSAPAKERPVKAEPVKVADDQAPPLAAPSASTADRPNDTAAAAPLAIAVATPTSAQEGAVAAPRPPAFVVASAGPVPITAAPALPQPSPPAAAAAVVSPTPLPAAAATSPPEPRPTSAQNAVPDPATPAGAETSKPGAGPDANDGTPPTIGQKIVEGTISNLSKGAVPAVKEKPGEKARLAPIASSAKAAGASSYSVKLASSVTEKDARLTMMQLQKEFPGALAHAYVRREDLGSEGVFYRVRVGPLSREAADKLCSQVKATGKTCTSVVGHTGA